MRPFSSSDVFVNPKNELGPFFPEPVSSPRAFSLLGGSSIFLSSRFLLLITTFKDLDAEWAGLEIIGLLVLKAVAEVAKIDTMRSRVKAREIADILVEFIAMWMMCGKSPRFERIYWQTKSTEPAEGIPVMRIKNTFCNFQFLLWLAFRCPRKWWLTFSARILFWRRWRTMS